MSRTTVRCSEKHTPQSPNKNRIRRNWMRSIPRTSDMITISHGALEACMMLEWQGQIQVCDVDNGVIESTGYMRESEYRDLKILPLVFGRNVQDTVRQYCVRYGVKNLGAVDVDLADTLEKCFPILREVLKTLKVWKASSKILLTFCNQRDNFSSVEKRIAWLRKRLPAGVRVVSYTTYESGRINDDASRKKGSAMCIVELKINP